MSARIAACAVVALIALAAACADEKTQPMAFGQGCGESTDAAPPVSAIPGSQHLAWADGNRVWALLPDCDEPYLAWEGDEPPLEISWSYDGQQLAFRVGDEVQVLRVDVAGVHATFDAAAYWWLPDGRLFVSNLGPVQGSVGSVADPASGTVQEVIAPATSGHLFAPAPDGSRIAYNYFEDCPPGAIPSGAPVDYECSTVWLSGVDGGGEHPVVSIADMIAALPEYVVPDQGIIAPVDMQWSSTGEWLVFRMCGISASLCMEQRCLFGVRADGSGLHYVDDNVGAVAWSPDGSRYVMVEERGRIYDAYPRRMIIRTPGPGEGTYISTDDVEDREPAWSPDGEVIAFTSSPPVRTPPCNVCAPEVPEQGIWTVRPDGSDRRQLTSSPDWGDVHPEWSRDSEWILFLRYGSEYVENEGFAHTELWLMRPDGADQHIVAELDGDVTDELSGGTLLAYDWWTGE
jgi:Tol biopolymer transport system component